MVHGRSRVDDLRMRPATAHRRVLATHSMRLEAEVTSAGAVKHLSPEEVQYDLTF